METQEQISQFQDWLGDGSLPLMRGLQLAHKLQAELHYGPLSNLQKTNRTCFTQNLLACLLDIVSSLNDGIHKLSSPAIMPPQDNTPFQQPASHHPCRKSRLSPGISKDFKHSPRELKRCITKFKSKLHGVKEGFNDGHTWHKYGQKPICGKTHPRSYYRCIHKRGLNCPALKQVQQCDGIARCFDITYIEKHTCEGICQGPHETKNYAASPLLSANSHTSLTSMQELNISHGEPSLNICSEIELEGGMQEYSGFATSTKSMLYSLLEHEMLPPPLQVTTSLEQTADNYGFPQAEEQHQESHDDLLPLDLELFPAFVDFEGQL